MSGVSRRYAQALYSVLGDASSEVVLKDLEALGSWLKDVPMLKTAIENPGIPYEKKVAIIEEIGQAAGFLDLSLRFALMVIANRRVGQWEELVGAFRGLIDEEKGIIRARLTTAAALKSKEVTTLAEKLGKIMGHPVRLDARESKELVGGLQLQVGSTVYDGSVAGALNSLRETLAKG